MNRNTLWPLLVGNVSSGSMAVAKDVFKSLIHDCKEDPEKVIQDLSRDLQTKGFNADQIKEYCLELELYKARGYKN